MNLCVYESLHVHVVPSDRISPEIDSSKLIVRFTSNLGSVFLSLTVSIYLDTFASLSLLNYGFRRASLRAAVPLAHLPDGISGLITRSDAVTSSDRLSIFGWCGCPNRFILVRSLVARLISSAYEFLISLSRYLRRKSIYENRKTWSVSSLTDKNKDDNFERERDNSRNIRLCSHFSLFGNTLVLGDFHSVFSCLLLCVI